MKKLKQFVIILALVVSVVSASNAQLTQPRLNLVSEISFDAEITSTDWLTIGNLSYVALGGYDPVKAVRIYLFDPIQKELVFTGASASFSGDSVQTVHWVTLGNQYYLAVGGADSNSISQEIRIYEFLPDTNSLTLEASAGFNKGLVSSVNWLTIEHNNSCKSFSRAYLAVGGNDNGLNREIRVYLFDPIIKELIPTGARASFSGNGVQSVEWLKRGKSYYLVAGGSDTNSITQEIRVYKFNPTESTLVLEASAPFSNGIVHAVSWLKVAPNLAYLAVAGDDAALGKEIRIYLYNASTKELIPTGATISFSENIALSVHWLVKDNTYYLAAGGLGDECTTHSVRLYKFTIKNYLLEELDTAYFNSRVDSVRWTQLEPFGDYLAAGGGHADRGKISIFKLDQQPACVVES